MSWESNQTKSKQRYLAALISALFLSSGTTAHAQTSEDETTLEEIQVFGVRRSLENALAVKRDASAIVDHISAEDISGVAALNLGEALQAIPGVQLSVEGARRQSQINLRGLPGGYLRTRANGHSFATPSQNNGANGQANPFGSFESSIFKGVTVYKSATADLQEGFISGVVDKKLPKALSQNGDKLQASIGSRYEQLNDSYDPEITIRGTKFLVEDTLAITGALGWSEQNFRRDSINFTRYDSLTSDIFPDVDQWRTDNGLSNGDVLLYPSEVRQFSEISSGDRLSYALNVEWQATDELKLGVDFLGTEKNLDEARQDVTILGLRNATNLTVPVSEGGGTRRQTYNRVTPTAGVAPIFGYQSGNENGLTDNYIISDIEYDNASIAPGTRDWDLLEKTDGIFLNVEWARDNLTVESYLTVSEAETLIKNTQFDVRYQAVTPEGRRTDGAFRTNGINGRIRTGEGNLNNYLVEVNGLERLNLDTPWRYLTNNNDSPLDAVQRQINNIFLRTNSVADDTAGVSAADLNFAVAGDERFTQRSLDTFGTDVTYDFDDSFVTSIKTGFKHSRETFSFEQYRNSPAYANLAGLNNDILIDPLFTEGSIFFNGNVPGSFGLNTGWLSFDVPLVSARLTDGIEERYRAAVAALPNAEDRETYEEPLFARGSGFLRKRDGTWETNFFESETDITSMYAMANFESPLLGVPSVNVTGNIGLRYAYTELETEGLVLIGNELSLSKPSNDYDNILPSFNMAMQLNEDLLFRVAAYRGIVRPNIAFFRPSAGLRIGDETVSIRESDTNINPYQADSFDMSLEWYNRAGSSISVGLFAKWVKNSFERTVICPEDGGGYGFGQLALDTSGDEPECRSVEDYTYTRLNSETMVEETITTNREIIINTTRNTNEKGIIRGFEAAIQQNLDFLPGFWSHFGGIINYSRVETGKSRILTGISEESYNLIGYWENDWLSTRLSYNWRSEWLLNDASSFTGFLDRNVDPRGRLDLSISATVLEDTKVTFRAYNITDDIYQEYQGGNRAIPKRTNYDGRTYSLGVSHTFF